MGTLGLGVMIEMLWGNKGKETKAAIERCLNQKIVEPPKIVDDILVINFEHGLLRIADEGQSCCESRYMVTDDDLPYYNGAVLLDVSIESGPDLADYLHSEDHEQQFLHVKTSKGSFTVVTHVEHNGYYGGFCVAASFTKVRT